MTENEDGHVETQATILPKSNFYLEEELCEAAKTNDLNKSRRILAERVDPDFLNGFGLSPLHLACQNGNYEVAKLLICNKAAVDFANAIGVTPLHLAAKNNHLKCAQLLLLCGANPSNQTWSQCRAKEFSPRGSRLQYVLEQAEQGILPNPASVFGLNVEPIVPKFSISKRPRDSEKKGKTTKGSQSKSKKSM
ncbi:hypothetical protein ACTXT7_013856 [Hymenolepis weldensis]